MSFRVFFVLLLVSILGFGCGDDGGSETGGGDGDGDGDGGVTLSGDVQAIFDGSCASAACHDADSPQGALDLSSASASFSALVGQNAIGTNCSESVLVVAGDSGSSYLLDKLDGSAACGSRMPIGGSPLSMTQLQTIADWIDDGAPNN